MGVSIRPDSADSKLSDADLWEQKVNEGLSEEQATAYVESRRSSLNRRPPGIPGVAAESTHSIVGSRPTTAETPLDFGKGLARTAAQGAGFGFGDEVIAGARALSPNQTYKDAVADERAQLKAFQQRHPLIAGTTEFGAAMAVPFGGGIKGAAQLGKVGKAAVMAGEAALAGAGASEGGVGRRAAGAFTGAGVAGALGAGGKAAGKAGRFVTDMLPGGVRQAASKSRLVMAPAERAADKLRQAVERDGTTLDRLLGDAVSDAKPRMLVDLAGENVQGVARSARALPSKAKQAIPDALMSRQAGQHERIVNDLLETTGAGQRVNVPARTEMLVGNRRAAAQPLYEAAYAKGDVADPAIMEAFQLPQFRAAYNRARKIAQAEGQPLPKLEEMAAQGAISVRALDYTKRGLDDLIDSRMASGKMGRSEARVLRDRLDGVLQAVDAQVPEYAKARQSFASDSKVIEALDAGQSLFKMTPDEAQQMWARMSDAEKDAFRKGAISQVADRIDHLTSTHDATGRVLDKEINLKRLRMLFDSDQEWSVFRKRLASEISMNRAKNNILGGSQTADKLAELDDTFGGNALQVGGNLATGNVRGAAQNLVTGAMLTRAKGYNERMANELTPYLTAGASGSPNELTAAIQKLMQESQGAEKVQRRAAAFRRKSSRVGGQNAAGGLSGDGQ